MTGAASPYEPAGRFRRTDAERRDPRLSWQRPDRAFFAAGACHVLAYEFLRLDRAARFAAVGLQRPGAPYLDHVYASDGTWAVDHCGLTLESELIEQTLRFEAATEPGLRLDRVTLPRTLEQLCARYTHRPPQDYPADPRPRARRYLADLLGADD